MSAAPIRVAATSRLAKEAVARLRAGKDKRGQKAFDLVAGVTAPKDAPKANTVGRYLNTKITDADGTFDSLTEHRRWQDLKLLQRAGKIRNLRRQVAYAIDVLGQPLCRYVADHVYEEPVAGVWALVVEDVKSPRTRKLHDYRLKNKLMRIVHGIEIREVCDAD